jgi:hypothetical protein
MCLFLHKQQSLAVVIIPCNRMLFSFSCAIPSTSAHALNCRITDASALHNFRYAVPYVFENSGLSVSTHLTQPISMTGNSYSRPWSTRMINCNKELWTYWHCPTGLLHWTRFRSPSTWKMWMCRRIKTRWNPCRHCKSSLWQLQITPNVVASFKRDSNSLLSPFFLL